MHAIATIAALTATLALTSANPILKRETCAVTGTFPWFIGPHGDATCSDQPPQFQPTSGSPPGQSMTCAPLDPVNKIGFGSAAVNIPCSDFPYTVTLYSTLDCSDPGVVTTAPVCLTAPTGGQFFAYTAVPTA